MIRISASLLGAHFAISMLANFSSGMFTMMLPSCTIVYFHCMLVLVDHAIGNPFILEG